MPDISKRPPHLERHRSIRAHTFLRLVAVAAFLPISAVFPSISPAAPESAVAPPTVEERFGPLDEIPETHVPRTARTWEEKALLESLAHFSTGRSAERREAYKDALRHYQRAFLFNPKAKDAARAAVAVAFKLKRNREALRWAVKTARIDPETSSTLLKHLAFFLIETREFEQAAEFHLRAFEAIPETEKLDPTDIRLLLDAARLFLVADLHEKSADCFATALDLLERPERLEGISPVTEKEVLFADPAVTIRLIVQAFLETDRTADAGRALNKLKPLIDDASFIAYIQAKIHKSEGKTGAALRRITKALSKPGETLDEERAAPYQLYAELLEASGQSDTFLAKLQSLFKKNPRNAPVGYTLAGRLYDENRLEDAASLYRRLLRDSPNAIGYQRLVTIYIATRSARLLDILGEIVEKTGSLQAVESDVRTIAQDADLMTMLDEAVDTPSPTPRPSEFGRPAAMALLFLLADKKDEAAEMFEAAIKIDPEKTSLIYRLWAGTLLLSDHPGEAAEIFRRELESADDEKKKNSLYILATALAMDDQYDEALKTARAAVKLDPEDPELQARIAWVLMLAGRNEEAIETSQRIIETLDSETDPETRATLRSVRLTLSHLYQRVGDNETSQELLLQVLDEFPGDVEASNDLGYFWADENRYLTVSLRLIDRAVEMVPDNAAYRDSLGWVYYRLGRLDDALKQLERAVELSENEEKPSGEIYEHLGDVNAALDRMPQAYDYWKQAEAAYIDEELPESAAQVAKKRAAGATDGDNATDQNVSAR